MNVISGQRHCLCVHVFFELGIYVFDLEFCDCRG